MEIKINISGAFLRGDQMKVAFISDIHGNAVALDAVLKDIETREVDKIFVLGDLCFRGPEPSRSLEIIRFLDCDVIKGNADEWLVRGINKGEVPDTALEIMNLEREWSLRQLDSQALEYLSGLPTELKFEYGKVKIFAFHATPDSLFEIVQPTENEDILEEKFMENEADIYIYAHIHKPYIRYIKGKSVINTGSVGLPFDGLTKASYALVDIGDKGFQLSNVRVEYDLNKVIKQFQESDYPNKELLMNILSSGKV